MTTQSRQADLENSFGRKLAKTTSSAGRNGFHWLAMLTLVALLACSCSKKSKAKAATEANPNATTAASQNATANTPPTAATYQPGSVAGAAAPATDVPSLQREVIKWIVHNRRTPKNFEEFAATAGIPIAPPPAGKKYYLTPQMHVQLIDQ